MRALGTKTSPAVSKNGMDLDRLRSLLAAPMAGLFLILALCTFAVQRPASMGIQIPLLKVRTHPYKDCDFLSDRNIVVQLHNDGSTWINETRVSAGELRPRLAEIYENRMKKVIFVRPDPEVSFGNFADIYNEVASSTNDLHIILSTRQLDEELHKCPEGSSCGLEWPDRTYEPCVWTNISIFPIPHHPLRWPGK